jgi:hypothetical protein
VERGACLWWGEAPEWPYDWAGGVGGFLLNDVNTPNNAPSRGPALDHGSARFQAYRHRLTSTHQRLRPNHKIVREPRPTTDELSTAGASNKCNQQG